jgi:hypothetical protein
MGYLIQYSDRLQTVRLGFESRQRQRIYPLISVSRPALRPTHLGEGVLSRRQSAAAAWRLPLTPIYVSIDFN